MWNFYFIIVSLVAYNNLSTLVKKITDIFLFYQIKHQLTVGVVVMKRLYDCVFPLSFMCGWVIDGVVRVYILQPRYGNNFTCRESSCGNSSKVATITFVSGVRSGLLVLIASARTGYAGGTSRLKDRRQGRRVVSSRGTSGRRSRRC